MTSDEQHVLEVIAREAEHPVNANRIYVATVCGTSESGGSSWGRERFLSAIRAGAAALAAQAELLDVLRRIIDDHLGISALDNYNASEALALLARFGLVKQVSDEDGGKFEWIKP